MIFPYRIDTLFKHYPIANWVILALTTLAFALLVGDGFSEETVEAMVEHLAPLVDQVFVTAPESARAIPPHGLADRVRRLVDVPVLVADEVEHALDMARAEAGPDGSVLVTGSLYLVGEVRELLA